MTEKIQIPYADRQLDRNDEEKSAVFGDLRESNEFLNLLLNNINSAVLIADENLRIHQFNDVFLNLFDVDQTRSSKQTFGSISGCVHAVLEAKECGQTRQCGKCQIRISLLETLLKKIPADHIWMRHTFHIDNLPVERYLEFSTRHIQYQGKTMAMVIIYDITEIEKQKAELEKKQRQLDLDLEAAAGIQQSLLPAAPPTTPGLRFAWKFEPCGQIGGDIFNIAMLAEDRVGLYMLDVCGHGVAAALISVSVSQFLQNIRIPAGETLSPGQVLEKLNSAFPFERFDSYFSIVYMVIDPATGTLTYSNAGHPPPLLIHQDGCHQWLSQHGPVIGLSDKALFEDHMIRLTPFDRILLHTDGILEIEAGKGVFFGKDGLMSTSTQGRNSDIQHFVERIYRAAKAFGKEQDPADDLSLLAVEFTSRT